MNTSFNLFDFVGGIHPVENKTQSTQSSIVAAGIPDKLILPLTQHIGAQSKSLVQPGDKVLKGQLIAEAQGFISANLHAPTSGTVTAVEDRAIAHQSGLTDLCIEITTDKQDNWIEHSGLKNTEQADPSTLINMIQQAGITGLGGAGFPTHVKASANPESIKTLIINAAECEPYITADDMLMQERAGDVVSGIQILSKILKPESVLIGIEDNKPKAAEALITAIKQLIDNDHIIDVVVIPTKYPSGGEKQLIQILTGKEVPSKGLPSELGIVCQNIGTAYAIHNAVIKGRPLISRITTMTGNACSAPRNYEVLIGTPVEHLLKISNTDIKNTSRLVMGGPMMGFTIEQIQTPIVKASNCIIAATQQELPDPAMEQACIRCGMCTEACPAQLLPQQLYWFAKSSNLEQAEKHNIADCIECGACSYVCPSNIPLVQYYRFAKGEIKQAQADKLKSDRAKVRFETRLARQARETAEKEAKRQARAEAAAKKQAEKKAAAAAAEPQIASNSPIPNIDTELLQKKFDASKAGVTKTKEKLAALTADENADADKVELLKAALEKTQTKMKDAAKTLAEAKKAEKEAATTDKDDPNTPERLKNKLDLAQARLETAKKRLAEAKTENSDKIELLETAVTKQIERVTEAQSAHQQAIKSTEQKPTKDAPAKPIITIDIETLKQKVLAAQTRVDKANERLNMAIEQNLETVGAFQTGLEKQTSKLADAKAALEKASTEEAK
jgi:electron transport complex protein RnfC